MQSTGMLKQSLPTAQNFIHWITTRKPHENKLTADDIALFSGSQELAKNLTAAALKIGILTDLSNGIYACGVKPTGQTDALLRLSPQTVANLDGQASRLDSVHPVPDITPARTPVPLHDLHAKKVALLLGNKSPVQLQPVSSPVAATAASSAPALCKNLDIPEGNIQLVFTKTNNYNILNINNNNIINTNRARARRTNFDTTKTEIPTSRPTPAAIAKKLRSKSQKQSDRQQREQVMRSVLSAPKLSTQSAKDTRQDRAYGLAVAYEQLLGVYQYNPTLKYLKGVVSETSTNFRHWLAAADIADSVGIGYPQFVKSQFWWFDKNFRRAPKPHQLSGKGVVSAAIRTQLYFDAVTSGEIAAEKNIVGNSHGTVDDIPRFGVSGKRLAHKTLVPKAVRFSNSERALRTFMKNYNTTAEEVFLRFAVGEYAAQYFDLQWLRQHPVYKQLKTDKKL